MLVCLPCKLPVLVHQSFQANGKLHVTAPNHVLYLKLCELCLCAATQEGYKARRTLKVKAGRRVGKESAYREAKLLNDTSILPRSQTREFFTAYTHKQKHDKQHSEATRPTVHTYLLAPVQTIFPELKMRAVVRGSLILMMTAAKRCKEHTHSTNDTHNAVHTHPRTLGLYSAFLARKAMVLRSNLHPRLTVDTMFL